MLHLGRFIGVLASGTEERPGGGGIGGTGTTPAAGGFGEIGGSVPTDFGEGPEVIGSLAVADDFVCLPRTGGTGKLVRLSMSGTAIRPAWADDAAGTGCSVHPDD